MPLGRPFTLIGSRNRAHLHLLSSTISRNHACIISTDTGLYLRDLASRSGVLVEGRKVKDVDLHDGDTVQIGSFQFRFADPAGNTRLGITPKPVAAMLEMDGSTLTPIDSRTILIGRRPSCDISLPEASVSNTHALIFEINGQRFIRDLGSRTGTLVNGKPVHHQELEFGDQIRVGDTEFRYVSAAAPQEQPPDLAPEDLAHAEDEEPIGLAFDERESDDLSEVESIPEAEEHELLPVDSAEEPDQQPVAAEHFEFAPVHEASEMGLEQPPDQRGHDEAIDFEIAGSQLDLQKKLVETSRLAAHPEEPPIHAITASDEVLQPVEDLGLDFWNDDAEPGAKGQIPAAPLQPDENVVQAASSDAPSPPEDIATHQAPLAGYCDEPAEHHLTGAPETAAQAEQEVVAPAPEPADVPFAVEAPPELADHVVTTDKFALAEPQPAVEEEPIAPAESIDPDAPSSSQIEPDVARPPAEAAPPAQWQTTPIDQVDLSVVDFGDGSSRDAAQAASAPWIEEPPEPPIESKPLLDLDAELPAAMDIAPPESLAPARTDDPETKRGRKSKLPRRPRGRKKKGQTTTELQDVAPAIPIESDASHDLTIPASDAALVASGVDTPEVIPSSEPTPDSAQDLGGAIEAVESPPAPISHATASDDVLTDSAFEQVVEQFTSPELGPIIEKPTVAESDASDLSAAADAQATLPDEGVTAAQTPAIPEPDAMVSPPTFTFESAALMEETATEPASTPDPSLDEVIELDSTALLDEVEEPSGSAVTQPDSGAAPKEQARVDNPGPPPAIDPFFGMSRDLGSFVGGIPLALNAVPARPEPPPPTPATPPPLPERNAELDDEFPSLPDEQAGSLPDELPPAASAAATGETPQSSPAAHGALSASNELGGLDDLPDLDALDVEDKLTFSEDPEPLPSLDTLLSEDQEPLELFEQTPQKLDDLPEGLEPIGDLSGALAEQKAPEPAPSPPPLPPAQIRKPLSPFAGAPLAGAPPKPKVTPPPPPKTSPLRSFTHMPFDISPEEVPMSSEGVPPFAGERPPNRARVTSFEGLAMPPVRETDVFSNAAFSGLDDVFFGAPPRDVPPIPAGKRQPAAAPPPGSAESSDSPAPSTEPSSGDAMPGASARKQRDRKREAIPPNRQALRGGQPGSGGPPGPGRPLAQPAVAPSEPGQPKRVPWWKRVRTLLPIMMVVLVGAWAGVYFALPPRHVIEGTLRLDGLDNLDTFGRKERADGIRKLLRRPELRVAAAENARNAGVPAGFLDDPVVLERLSQPSLQPNVSHSEFDDSRKALRLFHPTREPDLDRIRMKAVLTELYAEDGSQRDRAATVKSALDANTNRVRGMEQQRDAEDLLLKRLSDDVTAVGGATGADVLDGKLSVQTIDQQDQQLRVAWQKAMRDLSQRKADLEKAQTATPSSAQAAPQPDPELARLKAKLDSLNNQLLAAQNTGAGSAAQAAQAFAAAFGRFDEHLATLAAPADNVALTAYLESARSARDEVRQILQRTQSDAQALQQIRQDVGEQTPDPAASDGPLHDLLEERNAYAHRYEAAAGSGLAEDALKIKGVLDDLDQKIDARRQALKTGSSPAPQPAQESIAQLERDHRRDPQRISERLKRVEQTAPPPQAIPADARQSMAELGRRVATALAAAEQYAQAVATPDPTGKQTVAGLQAQLADVQAQLEGRRKALADAAAAELDQQQRRDRQAAVAAAQTALTAAMDVESTAAGAYTTNRKLLSAARDLTEEKGRAAELMQKLQVAREELDQQKKSAGATAVVLPPDDNSVLITYAPDRRVTYLVVVSLVIVLFFGILMWSASSQPAETHVPFANAVAVAHDVPGHHPGDFGQSELIEDDQQQPMIA